MMGRETALRMPLADFLALQNSMQGTMSNMALHNMTAAVQRIRMVKSRREIAKIRHSCGLACDVFEGLPEWGGGGWALARRTWSSAGELYSLELVELCSSSRCVFSGRRWGSCRR